MSQQLVRKIKSKEREKKKPTKQIDGEPNDQASLLRGHWGYGQLSKVRPSTRARRPEFGSIPGIHLESWT